MEIETVQSASKVLKTQLRLSILAEDQTKKSAWKYPWTKCYGNFMVMIHNAEIILTTKLKPAKKIQKKNYLSHPTNTRNCMINKCWL